MGVGAFLMPDAAESPTPAVLHFRDGTTEHVQAAPEIPPPGDTFTIWRETGDSEAIPLASLKAVFFLRPLEVAEDEVVAEGKTLAVEFRDGEVIRGTSVEYSPERAGFFLYPADRSKNDRIFVVNSAVLSIEVERF
jgi:hypothetical protein